MRRLWLLLLALAGCPTASEPASEPASVPAVEPAAVPETSGTEPASAAATTSRCLPVELCG